jgi:superfamily II DNA/RNA helicase
MIESECLPHQVLETMKSLYHSQPAPKCLLFVNSPHRVKIVCEKLWDSYGIPAEPLYGDQEREERVEVMRKLLDGRCRMAVTTEMGARGLDLPGLTHVVNLELPTDVSHYVHRAGRCGRAGAPGTVLSVVPQNKAFVVTKLANALGVPLHQMMIKGGEIAEIAPGARRGGGGGGAKDGGGSMSAGGRSLRRGGATRTTPGTAPARGRGAGRGRATARAADGESVRASSRADGESVRASSRADGESVRASSRADGESFRAARMASKQTTPRPSSRGPVGEGWNEPDLDPMNFLASDSDD